MLSRIVSMAWRLAVSTAISIARLGAPLGLPVTTAPFPAGSACLLSALPATSCAPTPEGQSVPAVPSVPHTIKRYLVALEGGQVKPLLSAASDRDSKRSSPR